MDTDFEVITDIREISRLNRMLGRRLSASFPYVERREIAYPSGHQTGKVHFEHADGEGVRAWSTHDEDNKHVNFLLHGNPQKAGWLQITVQLNFPKGSYNRRMGAAFVKDAKGQIFIAHRGKLTKGNAGLRKQRVFEEFAGAVIDAEDNKRYSRLILVAELDDSGLEDRLWEFADEAREVAKKLGLERALAEDDEDERDDDDDDEGDVPPGADRHRAEGRSATNDAMGLLTDYFDEFAGETLVRGRSDGRKIVKHGAIVKALAAKLSSGNRETKKSRAIDLALVAQSHVDLFEVKTSVSTTDIYTGTGQLFIHGAAVAARLGRDVRRHLVVPETPRAGIRAQITAGSFINIVTYSNIDGSYEFDGIPD